MRRHDPVSRSGDDSALPDEERTMLERARALIPFLAERAPAALAARRLPPETIAEYHAAGILRILQPRRFGGQQGRFSLFSRIVEELTYGCASSAWVYAVLAEHQWIIAQCLGRPRSRRLVIAGATGRRQTRYGRLAAERTFSVL
jgi:alkylation response protein AidB-like acyl-CoA dehydrogenase